MSIAPVREPLYWGYRSPAEIISHAGWLCYRLHLSHRDIEDLLAERGVRVSYEAVRLWCRTFGPALGARLRRHRRGARGRWHLDEVQLKIKGTKHWLWRAVDQDGLVLDILVQDRRNQEAAERFLRWVVDGEGAHPRVVITDKLASYRRPSSGSCREWSTGGTRGSTTGPKTPCGTANLCACRDRCPRARIRAY